MPAKDIFSGARGLLITAPWVLYLFVVDIFLSMLLPVSWIFPDAAYEASSYLAYTVWNWLQVIFEIVNGGEIEISGDQLPQGESAIVVANHVSWTDVYMIQAVAQRAGMLSRCRWFAKIQLKWVPFLGWGLWVMGFPLVSRQWMKDKKELDRVFAGIVKRKWPTWLISYSEATRYTPQKHEEARVWCKENDKPLPKHLLYPRIKGFVTTVQHLRKASHMKAVYDLTIAYSYKNRFLEAPTMWETLSVGGLTDQEGWKFEVHVARFELAALPLGDDELAEWLEQRWVAKGEWLDEKRMIWARGTSAKLPVKA